MPSADQVPVNNPHSTMRWHKWVVLIAGSTGSALRAVCPPNLHITPDGALYPQFLGGERRCPPEDCGGFPGYYDFLDNIASKQSKKRKAALDWYAHRMTRMRSASS